MINQKNPDNIFTGEGKDRIGPGQYNINREFFDNKKGTNWSSSRVPRRLNVRSNEGNELGPAAYYIEKHTGLMSKFRRPKRVECSILGGRQAQYSSNIRTEYYDSDYDSEIESEEDLVKLLRKLGYHSRTWAIQLK